MIDLMILFMSLLPYADGGISGKEVNLNMIKK